MKALFTLCIACSLCFWSAAAVGADIRDRIAGEWVTPFAVSMVVTSGAFGSQEMEESGLARKVLDFETNTMVTTTGTFPSLRTTFSVKAVESDRVMLGVFGQEMHLKLRPDGTLRSSDPRFPDIYIDYVRPPEWTGGTAQPDESMQATPQKKVPPLIMPKKTSAP